MNVKELIHSMLVENTGEAMGDSGGAYGRNWQRNAGKTLADFEKEPSVYFEKPEQWYTLKKDGVFIRREDSENAIYAFLQKYQPQSADHALKNEGYTIEKETLDSHDIEFTVSVFHYLSSVLEIDEVCEKFNALPCKEWDSETYGISKKQEKWLTSRGYSIGESWNTYNGDNQLSQTLQGTEIGEGGSSEGDYVLLQVHGGCDVRGGYTDAKLFKYQRFQEMLNPCPTVYGEIDGQEVSTAWDGCRLSSDSEEDAENTRGAVKVTPESVIKLYLENE